MARIPTKEELGNVQFANVRPEARFRPQGFEGEAAVGRALQGVGDAVQKVAVKVDAKAKEDDEYEVQKRLIDFDLEQEKRLDDSKRTAAPEARDFTSGYRKGYDESAISFMQNVPERLRPRVDQVLVQRGANFEKRAHDFELKERDRYHVEDVTRKLTDLYNDSTAAPDRWTENAHRGIGLIRASRLPANTRMRTEREFLERNDEYAARARLEARGARGEDLNDEIEALKRIPRGSPMRPTGGADRTLEWIKREEGDRDSGWDYRQFSGPYGVKRGENERLSLEEAERRAKAEIAEVQGALDAKIKTPLTPEQRGALTSLFYNIGTGKGRLDQVARLIDNGQIDKVPDWIRQYNRNADGGFMRGLADRREREAGLFASTEWRDASPVAGGYEVPADAAAGGAPAEPLLDSRDEPTESEEATYRHLTPTTRRKLLNVARTAQRGVMEQVVNGTITRVRNGEALNVDPQGQSAFDRALVHMTPHQKAEATAKMNTARMYADAVRGLQDKSSDEAEAGVAALGITDGVPDNVVASQQRAFQDALTVFRRLETVRQRDPALAVMGDPKAKLRPAREVAEAREKVKDLDKTAPDYHARYWETTLGARVAAQRRVTPDREPRLLTRQEAQSLIPMPAGTKFSDPLFRTTLAQAADTAQQRYGPAYAKAALQDAIRWTITGDDEKRMSAGMIAKIAVGERITARDLRMQRLIEDGYFEVVPNMGWGGGLTPSRDAEAQPGGFYGGLARGQKQPPASPPAPATRPPERRGENPFQKFMAPAK